MVEEFHSNYKISKQDEKCYNEIKKHAADLHGKSSI